MICTRCHKQVPENTKSCPYCNMLLKFEKKGLLSFLKEILFSAVSSEVPARTKQAVIPVTNDSFDNKTINDTKNNEKTYTVQVAGVTFENRQRLFKELIDLAKQETPKSEFYDGMTNKEIEEYATEPVQEIAVSGTGEIFLVPEPENKEDPNAIAVHHVGVGKIGYIPRKEVDKIKEILDDGKSYIEWNIVGGKYKKYDDYKEKVVTENLTYGMRLTFNYH